VAVVLLPGKAGLRTVARPEEAVRLDGAQEAEAVHRPVVDPAGTVELRLAARAANPVTAGAVVRQHPVRAGRAGPAAAA
jgi:hypothetical protein